MRASRPRVVAAIVAAGLVLSVVAGNTGMLGGGDAYAAGTTLTILGGDVLVRHGAGGFVPGTDGELLNAGDAVRTGANGRAVLTHFEGSSVTVEPGSELAIDQASPSSDGSTVVLMTQTAGRTWHVVTKLITGGSKYEVRTPASTASVRGTEFQVDATNDGTTVTTTEGTVVQHVTDGSGTTTAIAVGAGTTQTQRRDAPPAPARAAPEPERTVTVTVEAANSLVVDPLGRSNGVTRDGRVVVQTPGAQVRRDGGRVVVILPNLPDGKLTTRVDRKDDADDATVSVQERVEERGRVIDVADEATAHGGKKVAGFLMWRNADGGTGTRALEESEKRDLPAGKLGEFHRGAPGATPVDNGRAETAVPAILTPDPSPVPDAPTAAPVDRHDLRTPDLRTIVPRSPNTPKPVDVKSVPSNPTAPPSAPPTAIPAPPSLPPVSGQGKP